MTPKIFKKKIFSVINCTSLLSPSLVHTMHMYLVQESNSQMNTMTKYIYRPVYIAMATKRITVQTGVIRVGPGELRKF